MRHFLLIGIGGWLGAYSRYRMGLWIADRWGSAFPYGTLAINVTGCLVLGFFGTWAVSRQPAVPQEWRLLVAVGFLGAYTTFSTFGFETLQLLKNGQITVALANLGLSVGLGLLSVWVGAWAANGLS